jgi:hypothetical protein
LHVAGNHQSQRELIPHFQAVFVHRGGEVKILRRGDGSGKNSGQKRNDNFPHQSFPPETGIPCVFLSF